MFLVDRECYHLGWWSLEAASPQGTRAQAFIDAADRSWRQKLVVLPKVWAEILGMNATLPSNLNTDSNGKSMFPIFPSMNCCQITGGLVSSPCPHVYYFKRALQIWGWQTSICLDDIANLYIHSLSVAVNEAAVWLAGFSQANRCLHLHFFERLDLIRIRQKCSQNWQGCHQNSKLSSVYWT